MNRLQTTVALSRIFPDLAIRDYGADFNRLWQMEPLGGSHAIVVWSDTPIDPDVSPVNTLPHLTPFDWAIAACCRNPDLRVTVLDLRANQRDEEDENWKGNRQKSPYPALRWFRTQRKECVPWLRRVTIKDLVDVSDVDELRARLTGLQTTSDEAHPRDDRPELQRRTAEEKLPIVQPFDALRGLPVCQVDFSSEADHHAIANLIGPLLLLRNPAVPTAAGRANHQAALRKVLEAAEFAPKPKAPDGDEATVGDGGKALTDLGPVRFVMIDDQWHHGWAEWVAECLGLPWDRSKANELDDAVRQRPECLAGQPNAGVSLWVLSAPQWLLNRVRTALTDKERDARFGLSLTGGDSDCSEILLFDLRLMPLGSDEEVSFTKKVAEVAQRFTEIGAWPPISKLELDYLKARQPRTQGRDDDEAKVLTLLPRLIAQADLSLPIVLFSSTGRRDIVKKLEDYGSIIRSFEKPRFLGYRSEDVLQDTQAGWKTAIGKAAQLLAGASLCRRILSAAAQSEVVSRRAPPALRHFELYLDESGKSTMPSDSNVAKPERKRFVIGGLLVGYSSEDECGPLELHTRMESHDLRWFPEKHDGKYLIKEQRLFNERKNLPGAVLLENEEIINFFLECLDNMQVYGICAEYETDAAFNWRSGAIDPSESDNRYRLVLSTLLEVVIFDLLPEISQDWTISVFVATRNRSANDFEKNGQHEIKQLSERFGHFRIGPYLISTFNEDAVFPIVVESCQRRRGLLSADRLKYARGVTLAYPELIDAATETDESNVIIVDGQRKAVRFERPKWSSTRHQHYIADVIAKLCREYGGAFECESGISKVFGYGMYDVFDTRLGALLIAARSLDTDDRPGAVLALEGIDFTREFDRRSAAALLLKRLARVITDDFVGHDFSELANGIEIRGSLQENPASPHPECGTAENVQIEGSEEVQAASLDGERGTVASVFLDRGFGFIKPCGGFRGDCYFNLTLWREGQPSAGVRVEFERYQITEGVHRGKWRASWLRPLAQST